MGSDGRRRRFGLHFLAIDSLRGITLLAGLTTYTVAPASASATTFAALACVGGVAFRRWHSGLGCGVHCLPGIDLGRRHAGVAVDRRGLVDAAFATITSTAAATTAAAVARFAGIARGGFARRDRVDEGLLSLRCRVFAALGPRGATAFAAGILARLAARLVACFGPRLVASIRPAVVALVLATLVAAATLAPVIAATASATASAFASLTALATAPVAPSAAAFARLLGRCAGRGHHGRWRG